MLLSELSVGQTAVVTRVGGDGALRQHFLDMGLIPGAEVTLVKYAPMGDPMELRLHGYELTLRLDDAARIEIENPRNEEPHSATTASRFGDTPHPAYGEGKSFQPHYKEEHSAPVETRLQFALVGNQNCGKTTLFNQLTGSNQHVGNFPGVTVDRKTGVLKLAPAAEVTDLPGIYSLSPYSSEEIVSREFILREKPTAVINIVDATNIERNLYLTMQLMGFSRKSSYPQLYRITCYYTNILHFLSFEINSVYRFFVGFTRRMMDKKRDKKCWSIGFAPIKLRPSRRVNILTVTVSTSV